MKYCINCGMLLEDTHEVCIGCGKDVTSPESTSKYPPDVQRRMENSRKKEKEKNGVMGMILIVFVLLLVMIGVFVFLLSKREVASPLPAAEPANEVSANEEDAIEEEVSEEASEPEEKEALKPAVVNDDREINDKEGHYYNYAQVKDSADNIIFTSIYPEDFVNVEEVVDYEKYSIKFPQFVTFVTGNAENTARFFYMSPQQFWYKESETGKTRSNERDMSFYMSYLKYDGPQAYVESLLKSAYEGAKKITLVEEKDVDETLAEKFAGIAKNYTKSLTTGNIGDYANIGEDTEYAVMQSESSARIYKYEVVTKESHTLFCDYYVPMMANNLYYSSDRYDDRGTIVEWIVPCVIGFEAGNEDIYDDFKPDFDVFMKNSAVTKMFYYTNNMYGEDVTKVIDEGGTLNALDAELLKKYGSQYKSEASVGEFDDELLDYINTPGAEGKTFVNTGSGLSVNTSGDINVAFIDTENGKAFLSVGEEEYPGYVYTELKMADGMTDAGNAAEENSTEGDSSVGERVPKP